jgi:serine protease
MSDPSGIGNATPFLDISLILEAWRSEQAGPAQPRPHRVRFVFEFATSPGDHVLREMISRQLGLEAVAEPLFEDDVDLAGFRLVAIPNASRPDRADLFEVAAALRRLAGAETVEPDLGTDYYDWDRRPPPPGSPESADWAFWCWADDGDQPDDRDWAIAAIGAPAAVRHALA